MMADILEHPALKNLPSETCAILTEFISGVANKLEEYERVFKAIAHAVEAIDKLFEVHEQRLKVLEADSCDI